MAAARDRFPGRRLSTSHAGLWLVHLEGPPSVLRLTHQATLDALGLDDRVNTGRLDGSGPVDPLLATSQSLADHVWDWWGGNPPPLVYRTRTMPTARSLAFVETTPWAVVRARPLAEATALLVALVLRHGFDVPDAWLEPSALGPG